MFKDRHPIQFNDVTIPFMSKWEERFDTIENVYETEAGTDDVDIIRKNKLSISCTTVCFADQLQTFIGFSKMNKFLLTKYNPETGNDIVHSVRMRDFSYKMVPKSWDLESDGVWEVSFTLKEF